MSEKITTSYSQELAKEYTDKRDEFNTTEQLVFEQLSAIGLINKDMLDLGCGDGRHAKYLKELGAKSVLGIDSSPSMITLAQSGEMIGGVYFIQASAENIPVGDSALDIILSNFVIHYLKDLSQTFKEMYRVLRQDGYAVITFNIFETDDASLHNTEIPLRLGADVVVINLIKTHVEIQDSLKASGFKITRYEVIDSSYLSVDQSYGKKESISAVKNIICVVQKTK